MTERTERCRWNDRQQLAQRRPNTARVVLRKVRLMFNKPDKTVAPSPAAAPSMAQDPLGGEIGDYIGSALDRDVGKGFK